jgi:RNA polymerase sigma factor (sigma-70 family)
MGNDMHIVHDASWKADERILLQKVSQGNWHAYTHLFNYYMPKLSAYIFPFTGDSIHDTEEVIQEVFLKIWEKKEMLLSIRSFDSYLFRMAKNKLIDLIDQRRAIRKRNEQYTSLKKNAIQSGPDEDLQYRQYTATARDAIESLSPKLKAVFVMSTEEELSLGDISEKLAIPRETVKKRLYLASQSIKNFLKKHGEWLAVIDLSIIFFRKF